MKLFRTLNAFDRLMAAISFAEADEHETARRIIKERRGKKRAGARKAPEKRPDNRPRLQM